MSREAGVAIADVWKSQKRGKVVFVGARGGIEERLVPRAGYTLELLTLGSLKRVSLMRRIKTLLQLPLSLLRSMSILIRERPKAVVGVGGYASGPLVLMARLIGWMWGARVGILEQNAVPGLTNRILGRFSHRVLSAFPGVEAQFPRGKVEVSGNPVRAEMKPLPSAPRDPFTIFIFGGSQGAQGINSLILDAIPLLGELKSKVRFIHQTGEKDFERVRDAHAKLGTQAQVERFIYDMVGAYGQASLLVCRAGSSTLAEVAAVRRASVLVPFPYAADNHQEKNARIFEKGGAARVLVQFDSKGEDLARVIRECIENPARVDAMEKAAASYYRPDAAKDVVGSLLR